MNRLLFAFCILTCAFCALNAQPSFPGAEGYGAITPGGRGGQVILVTNTNPTGPGSFHAAMHTSGKRIVVFRVSGVINLVNTVRLEPASLSYVTVAGQTSPGGVTITCNNGTPVGTGYTATRWHDGIFRFLRFRVVRNTGGNGGDHSFGFYQAQNFIIDHCDFSGGDDECVDFMYSGHFSFQWSTVANSGPGGQRYGLLMNGTKHPEFPQSHISIHHCLFANHNKRGPEIHWGYEATTVPDSGKFDYRCNVVYNILQYGVYVSVVPSILTMNIVGNYFRHSHKIDEYWPPCNIQTGTHVFIKDNYWDSPGKTSSTAIRITSRDDPDTILHTQYMKPTIVQNEWNFAPVTTTPAHESYDTVLARVGAWPRDSMNKRTVRDVIDNVGEIGDCSEPYITSGPAPPADTDNDGMPDFWEDGMGFDKNSAADNAGDHDGDGYMNIEEYINDVALARVCNDYYNPVYPLPSDWPDYNPACCKSLTEVEKGVKPADRILALALSPNPFNSVMKIAASHQLLAVSKIKLEIYDINGKLVDKLITDSRQLKAGINWNAQNFSPGVYLVKVRVGSKTVTQRIVLQR